MSDFFRDAFLISGFSRSDAILDGVLIPITDLAKQRGFVLHTAITSNLASEITLEEQLPVLLRTLHEKIKLHQGSEEMISTQTISKTGKVVTVFLHIGPGDNCEPVLTLMLPEDM